MAEDNTDTLDRRIVDLLAQNGRTSNIDIARALSVSEATVRQHVKKMVESETIRFKALVDFSAADVTVVALVRITVAADKLAPVVAALKGVEQVHFLSRLTGRHNLLAILHAEDNAALDRAVHSFICMQEGVLDIDCRIISRAVKFDSRRAPIKNIYDMPTSGQVVAAD